MNTFLPPVFAQRTKDQPSSFMVEMGVAGMRSLISVTMVVKPHHAGNLSSTPLKPGWSTKTGKRAIIAGLLFCLRTSGPTKTTSPASMVAKAPSRRVRSKKRSCPMAPSLPCIGWMVDTTPLGESWRFVMPLKELCIERTTLLNAHLLAFEMMVPAAAAKVAAAAAFSASVPAVAWSATSCVAVISASTAGPSGLKRFAPRSN
mmetsp:Transcript_51546/g.167291  ORF Transcript_51546/g.167291 Transcript_51546/m.167291 type:complete len:203 (-) Transcript_51546:423-1031(-)